MEHVDTRELDIDQINNPYEVMPLLRPGPLYGEENLQRLMALMVFLNSAEMVDSEILEEDEGPEECSYCGGWAESSGSCPMCGKFSNETEVFWL